MPRPRLRRRMGIMPDSRFFKPRGVPMADLEMVILTHEEVEALRLKNLKKMDQAEAAQKMNTSQSTFQRILSSAYEKVSDAVLNGKAIKIED